MTASTSLLAELEPSRNKILYEQLQPRPGDKRHSDRFPGYKNPAPSTAPPLAPAFIANQIAPVLASPRR